MRPRPLTWLLLSVLCFAAAFYFWRLGDRWTAQRTAAPAPLARYPSSVTRHPSPAAPLQLLSQAGTLNSPPAPPSDTHHASRITNQFALRLSNTTTPLSQLMRNDHALLLENALLDTAQPAPTIPDHLRAQGDPGSYLVQARGPIDDAFRSLLKAAGATVVSYIPNNAYLVRASADMAQQLQADPRTQAVLPYEPYYKLKPSLLKLAAGQQPLPGGSVLNLLLFADAREGTLAELKNLGAQILGEDQSPFGPVVNVRPPVESLPALAGLSGVQELEMALARASANDLSRVRVGVSVDTLVPTNYLGLTGTNVLVNVNDSGVDATHPDLQPRVFGNSTNALVDPNGHGTHVAGIIASSGGKSSTVTNASGPNGPYSGTNTQFRGMAPGAKIFVQPVGVMTKPFTDGATLSWPSDGDLQQGAAQTNAFISNNSWNYVGNDSQTYDLHAASYDAAVRDALPNVPGSQPLLVVFSAGNAGRGNTNGTGGIADSVESPGTAKNVITVGAIEQLRNITNVVTKIADSTTNSSTPWLSMTDSSDQVAGSSSRGNVGIGIEGEFGRFKPDVVAPGTFVVSTRSGQWDTNAYYNPTSHIVSVSQNLLIVSNVLWVNAIDIPDNAVQLNLSVVPNTNSPVPFPDLLFYVNQAFAPTNAASATVIGTNNVSLPPDGALSPVGALWFYAIANFNTQAVYCDLITDIVVTNNLGDYLQVLAGLNDSLGPFYRYESGTSMAAADASGMLALMQEFFESRLGTTNHSPALMKALLINGARTVAVQYDFNTRAPVNIQGWGLINLPTSLPGGLTNLTAPANSIFVVEQDPTNALATGQSNTRQVSVAAAGRNQPLRVTLVWTDPPGNPIAGVKLVNDLDLVVTNLDNGSVYFGNDIISGSDFNLPWDTRDTNTVPNIDVVNNVENVYLSPRIGTNYSVTVVGRHVNVNAVTANPNNVAQDYALVISSGDGLTTNALTVASTPIVYLTQPLVTVISNQFTASPGLAGGFLFNQRVGASTPLLGTNSILLPTDANGVVTLGMTNQWHFYVITNTTTFTNAAFVTFLPPSLAVPRMGVFEPSADRATRPEADIDLYVAPPSIPNNFALTNLDSTVVEAADKALSRGGTETIVYSNSTSGVYYIGVQSQDQQAAEYAILGVFSQLPFGQSNSNGDLSLIGIPAPAPIPDATVDASGKTIPGTATIVCIAAQQIKIHRVVVTNNISHELMGDMLGTLTFSGNSVVLNNHSPDSAVVNQTYIYDDSQERNVPGAQHTDGPGSLMGFGNKQALGPWIFTEVDSAPSHTGTNNYFLMFLERQQDLTGNGITATIEAGACREDFLDVPTDAISLTVTVAVVTAPLPIAFTVTVCPANGGPCKSVLVTNALGGSVTIDQTDLPPLAGGTSYTVTTCNLGSSAITVNIRATFGLSFNTIMPVLTAQTTVPVPIRDDAVTDIYLTNNLHNIISSLDVGLLIKDPRISDLAITLISPNGTRVLLFENRGADSANGLGTFNLTTNFLMAPFYTNNFDPAPVGLYATGAVFQGWNVVSNRVDVLDDFTCLCLSNHILALLDGAVTNTLPTTNSLPITNSNPYALTFKVNHLPWLEGMVTWWPLDVGGSDIFGGFDGLLLGDVAFSTGPTNAYFDNFDGPLNPIWQQALPDRVGTGAGRTPFVSNLGPPDYTFTVIPAIGTNTVIELRNKLDPFTRRGWISSTTFNGQNFRYEARFNTLTTNTPPSGGGFLELWILDAANSNRFDVVSPFGGAPGTTNLLLAGSSIESSYNTLSFNYQTNTWYRLVLSAAPGQGVHAAVLSDAGTELAGVTFIHGASAFPSGFKIGLSQFVGAYITNSSTVDVAIDWVSLTAGLAGEVNQAYFGDGVATRMIVPRCPELDLGLRRGFSVEGWINPGPVLGGSTGMSDGFENATPGFTILAGSYVSGWHVDAGNIDVLSTLTPSYAVMPDSGTNCIDINGNAPGTISTNLLLVVGRTYQLSFAYTRNPDSAMFSVPQAAVSVAGSNLLTVIPNWPNTWSNPQWRHTSVVFTASSALSKLQVQGLNPGVAGVFFDSFKVTEVISQASPPQPLVEWNDPTNVFPQGVQLWLSGLPGTNVPGTLWANIWDTNLQPHIITTVTNAITNGGWQHVALTYDTNSGQVALYINGLTTNNQPLFTTNLGHFVPRTSGDLYFGFHPPGLPNGACFAGGLDEFSVYDRALSPCEVNAIFHAGSRGKYGTNVLVCPVTTEVTLLNTTAGTQIFTFTNGVTWTNNGPHWETNTIPFFTPSTNPTPIIVRGLNPYDPTDPNAPNNLNAVVDDFVLSELVPQVFDGLLHFTEDTNLAVLPIKFASAPYVATNFPPVLIFSNDFKNVTAGIYRVGATILGGTNSPFMGPRNWKVANGPVTVVSNAFFDVVTTNWLAMATGAVQCLLPTSPGHRYQLSYSLRGPCAVGWWNGSVDPLSQRAQDLISGNDGAFFYGATNTTTAFFGDTSRAYVGRAGFFFGGQIEPPPANDPDIFPEDIDDPSSRIELGDPPQLRFTNAFTIEGWFKPTVPTLPANCGTEQLFFRGYPEPLDCRGLGDPYWLALEPTANLTTRDIHFHIAADHSGTRVADVFTTNAPIQFGGGSNDGWWHITAVFDKPFTNITVTSNGTNFTTITTNSMRLYLNGTLVASNYTTLSPFQDLDLALSPGVSIGDRCRYDWTQPYSGYMDELTVYARALTEPEIAAIAAAGILGKADSAAPVSQSLAKLSITVDGAQLDVGYGDNSQWSARTVQFTALETNAVVVLQSLLPGTLLEGVTLTELPPELYYLPEVSLSDIYGEDAFGVWTLEIWDNRAGPATTNAQLVEWQLNLGFAPINPPPVIDLSHGIAYTNSLPAYGIQYFVVPVPQWATRATNILEFARQVRTANPLPVTVLFNQTNFPTPADYSIIGPLVSAGSTTLFTNGTPPLVPGQNYYLALTNPNPVGVTFALGVWFDITTLSNCQMLASNVVGVAGIPRYFQFDVPTNGFITPQSVALWLSGPSCDLKVVLSEHLPLPDLNHFDYTSQQPCTNDQIVMLVTNSSPFPIQTNRWYVGVFNTGSTNATFSIQACSTPLGPTIIPLTNGIPFVVSDTNNAFAAPPGPPQLFFFDFLITESVPGVLFELYNASGDADLVLQQSLPPTMAPYFATSFFDGTAPEQIVLRTNITLPAEASVPDLRGHWYLGVYNHEQTNITYTIRAVLPDADGLLVSAQPLDRLLTILTSPSGILVSWHSVVGEHYIVQSMPRTNSASWSTIGSVTATTPFSTFEVQPVRTDRFQVLQVFSFQPVLKIQRWPTNQVRISWSTALTGYTLQSKLGLFGTWVDAIPPATPPVIIGNEYVVFDNITTVPFGKYYRLIK